MGIIVAGVKSRVGGGFNDGGQGAEGMDVQVPVLNSTVKLGKEMEVVARGRVSVRDIFLRWFIWKEYEGEKEGGQEEEDAVVGIGELCGEGEEQAPLQVAEGQERSASVSGESDDDEL